LELRRLNWGCGRHPQPGWINSDAKEGAGIDLSCDIRDGLPLENDSIDYAVSIHALPELPYPDLVPTLVELRRVLKPDGVLRLGLPDLERAIDAYRRADAGYFLVPDEDARSLGGKLVVQLTWYGYVRSLFTREFTEELLAKASFVRFAVCKYGRTASSHPEIVELDNREQESLFVEAWK
jgi:predicted SAM-dependent methyltransferase